MQGKTILLVILLIVLLGVGFLVSNPEAGQQLLVDLELATPIPEGYTVSGMLEAHIVSLASQNGGRVLELPLAEGERVRKGQVVARLDAELLNAQLAAAKAGYQAALAQLKALQAGPREEDLAVVRAQLALAQVALENAQQALEDARSVDEGGATREEQIAVSRAGVDQAQAGVDQAQAALQALTKGASEGELAAAQAALDAAVAQVNQVKSQIALQTLVAPIDGWILKHLALPGEMVLPGWPVVTLADLSELELVVYVPEMDLKWIRVGDPAKIRVDAYPDKTFSGQVVRIADQAEYTPRNVQTPKERVILVYAVHLRVPNPDGILKPGLPADATFEVQP